MLLLDKFIEAENLMQAIIDTRPDHLNFMNDKNTFEDFNRNEELRKKIKDMKRSKIKDSIVELKSDMKKLELLRTNNANEFYE